MKVNPRLKAGDHKGRCVRMHKQDEKAWRDERRVLDLKHLDQHTFGDAGLRAEVLNLFTGQLGQYLAALEASSSHVDWLNAAHTLKGSARAIGAGEICALCETLEDLPDDRWRDEGSRLLPRLRDAAEDCRHVITRLTA